MERGKREYAVGFHLNNNYKGLGGLFSLFNKLYGKRVRAVVDLHGVLRTKILNLLFRLTFTKVQKTAAKH